MSGDDDGCCQDCSGEGIVVICWDDMCANSDECIHGDGYGPCRACHGTGVAGGLLRDDGLDDEVDGDA